ncbi:PepSY domain-containing protein [Vibrio sp. E150_011]|uniref:PepSY domain-containing protein n=1 Tax=Vibrio sp. 10N.261.51.F12 TaxID=3229679 RepID=UPI00354E6BAC
MTIKPKGSFLNSQLPLIALSFILILPATVHAEFFSDSPNGHELVQDVPLGDARIEFDEDQDEVYEAVQDGLIRPFSELFATVENDLNGRVIKVELEEDDNEWTYELKLMHEQDVIQVEYNATTLELMEIKGHNLQRVIKK